MGEVGGDCLGQLLSTGKWIGGGGDGMGRDWMGGGVLAWVRFCVWGVWQSNK